MVTSFFALHPPLKENGQCSATCFSVNRCPKLEDEVRDHGVKAMMTGQGDFFQIDSNLGVLAAIAEMLLQSHTRTTPAVASVMSVDSDSSSTPTGTPHLLLHLLPALPKEWAEGRMVGMRGMGGLTVNMWWARGVLQEAWIASSGESSTSADQEQNSVVFVVATGSGSPAVPTMELVSLRWEGAEDAEAVAGEPEVAEVAGLTGVVVRMGQGQQVRLRCDEKEDNCIAHTSTGAAEVVAASDDNWLDGWREGTGGWTGGGSSTGRGKKGAAGSIPTHSHPSCG
jgi:hypothetical protein